MKRTSDVGDNKAVVKSIASTKLDTVVGPIAWDGKNVPPFAAKNITKTPLVGGQWRHREGNKYDIVITDNKTFPESQSAARCNRSRKPKITASFRCTAPPRARRLSLLSGRRSDWFY